MILSLFAMEREIHFRSEPISAHLFGPKLDALVALAMFDPPQSDAAIFQAASADHVFILKRELGTCRTQPIKQVVGIGLVSMHLAQMTNDTCTP